MTIKMTARIISGTHAPASTMLLLAGVILASARCSVQGQVVAGRRVAAVAAPARDPADQTTPLDNSGLHIKAAGRVNFGTGYHIMNDGGGYRWDTLTRVLLSNGDELFGQLAADKFTLTTDYGQIDISRNRVKSIQFRPQDLGQMLVHTWKGSVLKGRMLRSPLGFQIAPDTSLRIHAGHLVSLVRPLALPPETARRRIERLVAQLGAESYKDRQKATKALAAMGKSIVPILRKQLSSTDPEINHRISLILEQLSTASSSPPTIVPHPARHIILKGRGG